MGLSSLCSAALPSRTGPQTALAMEHLWIAACGATRDILCAHLRRQSLCLVSSAAHQLPVTGPGCSPNMSMCFSAWSVHFMCPHKGERTHRMTRPWSLVEAEQCRPDKRPASVCTALGCLLPFLRGGTELTNERILKPDISLTSTSLRS